MSIFPECYKVKDIELILNKGFYSSDNCYISFVPIYFRNKKPLLYLKIIINSDDSNINYDVVNDSNKPYSGFYRRDESYKKFNELLDKKILYILNGFVKDGLFYKVNKVKKTNKKHKGETI